jgi:hypothetical protein
MFPRRKRPAPTQSHLARKGALFLFAALCFVLAAGVFAPKNARAISCGFGSDIGGGRCRGFITTAGSGTWTVPGDWNLASNTIELIGAGCQGITGGSGGSGGAGFGGCGGGAYAAISNQSLSGTIGLGVGTAGTGGSFSGQSSLKNVPLPDLLRQFKENPWNGGMCSVSHCPRLRGGG